MSKMTPLKPHLIRALYDWILENHLTPYISVDVNYPGTQVPQEYVQDGRIVLDISPTACRGLVLENDRIVFTARFSGQPAQIYMMPGAVLEIYAKENGRGMSFPPEEGDGDTLTVPTPPPMQSKNKPPLKLVEKDD